MSCCLDWQINWTPLITYQAYPILVMCYVRKRASSKFLHRMLYNSKAICGIAKIVNITSEGGSPNTIHSNS